MARKCFSFCLVWLGVATVCSAQPALPRDKPLVRIAFGSCADQDKPCPCWDAIAGFKPDVLLLLGDNIYADIENGRVVPADAARVLEKYKVQAAVPGFRKVRNTIPILAVWDDHDYGKNDGGGDLPFKDLSQTYFLDFWGVPKDDPRRNLKGVYSARIIGPVGKRVQVILLDGRYHRSPLKKGARRAMPGYSGTVAPYLPNTDPDATMLGEEQWTWLEEQLKKPAELRLVCSGIQVIADEPPFEKWANFPNELNRLYKLIRDTKATGVVLLSGDRHLGDLSCRTDVVGYPLFDLTSSGLNQGSKNWRPPDRNRYRLAGMPYQNNFGTILIDWDATDVKVTLQLRDDAGELRVSHPFRLRQLRPTPGAVAAATDEPIAELPRPDGVLTPAEAAKMLDKEVTVQFAPASGRVNGQGDAKRIFLNSEKDYRSETNFTVMMTIKALTDKYKDATFDTFRGKTIRVKGTVKLYQNRPEIDVSDETQITVVEK
ncbi:MAG TPA: alkaline phosphatase D family protein [Fimbriiglobus sp.]